MSHEDLLLEVLQKIGASPDNPQPFVPEVVDSSADHLETVGDPSPIEVSDEPASTIIPDAPTSLRGRGAQNLFVHHDAHPVVLDIALLGQYGPDWYGWEAETLWRLIAEDFRTPSISDHVRNKIQAVKTLHINEWFWTKWEVFCWITQALNNNIPDFQVLQKPSLPQLFVAVDVAELVRGGEQFSQELQDWVAAAVVDEGVIFAPEPISFCQDEIERLLQNLGNPEALALIPRVRERWEQLQQMTPEQWESEELVLKETAEDVQCARLLVARDYRRLRQRQMREQLRLLR